MNILQQTENRVEAYLKPRLRRLVKVFTKTLVDPRKLQGRRHELAPMLLALVAGALAGSSSMRAVEELSARLGLGRKRQGFSDTALARLLAKLDENRGIMALAAQVKDMAGKGQLGLDGWLGHWTAIDGKYDRLPHYAGGLSTKHEKDGNVWWQVDVLHAVLTTAADRPAPGQIPLAEKEGEITALLDFVHWHVTHYGKLMRNSTPDAGLCSKALFETISGRGFGLLCGLMENKPELRGEAERLFRVLRDHKKARPEEQTGWQPCSGGKS